MSEENSNQPINDAAELQKLYASGERNFKKANLTGADLRDTDLRGADLQGANLKGANLRGANLKGTNLQGANLKESDLRGTSLIAANLKAATLCGASMELAMLQEADLQRANLRGANLGGATLIGANLEKTDLTFTDFSDTYMVNQGSRGGANLSKASFKGANLKGTNFQGANLKGANLQETNLKDAYPQGASYDWTTRFPNNFDPVRSGMEKAHTSAKQSNKSTSRLNPIPIIATVVLVGVPTCVISVQKLGESNKPKPVVGETSELETEVSFDANRAAKAAENKNNTSIKATDGIDNVNVSKGDADTASVITSLAERQEKLNTLAGNINKTSTVKLKAAAIAPKVRETKKTSSSVKPANACPALVRAINAANPDSPSGVDIIINGQKAIANVPFTQASRYVNASPGLLFVQIVKAGTKKIVAQRTFTATPNGAYSIAVTGPLRGQYGEMLFNESPFVIQENLSQPESGKFKGRFYNLSETKDTTNLRIVESDTPKVAVVQPVKLMPKTVVDYPQLSAGSYNFNPVLLNKSEPLINSAYKPPIRVEIAKAKIPDGTIFDVIAVGNPLGKGQNSLKLSAASYKALPSTKAGCMRVQ